MGPGKDANLALDRANRRQRPAIDTRLAVQDDVATDDLIDSRCLKQVAKLDDGSFSSASSGIGDELGHGACIAKRPPTFSTRFV